MHRFSRTLAGVIVVAGYACTGCISVKSDDDSSKSSASVDSWTLTSPDFTSGGAMPPAFTCNGGDFASGANPELDWTGGPDGTQSYALVLKDISITARMDATTLSDGYSWDIWNIPASTTELPHDLSDDEFPAEVAGARQWSLQNQFGYLPPCPNGDPTVQASMRVTDQYAFTLYAVPTTTLADPAYDPDTSNYVEILDLYLKKVALKDVDLLFTSNAASASPAPPLDPAAVVPPSTSD